MVVRWEGGGDIMSEVPLKGGAHRLEHVVVFTIVREEENLRPRHHAPSIWGLMDRHFAKLLHTTRRSTHLSSKDNLPAAIDFRSFYGANLATGPLQFRVKDILDLHLVGYGTNYNMVVR